jgi:hypothetical protein
MSMKPLPSLPSPTLTNPDLVLPDEPQRFQSLNSPPRYARNARPPSPGYLFDTSSRSSRDRSSSNGSGAMPSQKKEKRGLMSRKLLLLRSRTASSATQVTVSQPTRSAYDDYHSAYASSPTLMDVGNLAPEMPQNRRTSTSGSSLSSEDLSSLPQFLAKYEQDTSPEEDELDVETPVVEKADVMDVRDLSLEAQRRQQEQDEQTSALLSQRAEQILANAKKRLNV